MAVTLKGNAAGSNLGKRIVGWADEVALSGSAIFDDCPLETVTVNIAKTDEEFREFARGNVPDWGIGVANRELMSITIKDPALFSYSQSLGEVIRHEFAHLYLENCCSDCQWPRWFHEGCAVMFSGEWRVGRDVTVARALVTSSLPALNELDDVNNFTKIKADIAYSLSYLAVRYFIDTYGRQGLRELLMNQRAGQSFSTAFFHATGKSYSLWEKDFKNYLKKRYFFIFWFGDWPFFWTAMVLFFIFIYVMKRRQMKRKTEEWDKTDRFNNHDYGKSQD
ncbi:MAG: hypothetical protein GY855_09645 [candidate division Zixibacteria bacterium]|nr:hypothetical protein [candidate division Zixibacteria bacterium]